MTSPDDPTIFMTMDNGTSIKMNGHANGSFMNGTENVKALSNSKMSLQSLRSNASTANSVTAGDTNGNANTNADTYEDKEVFLIMEQTDRRFGFSVTGGVDDGFPPKIDGISRDSPAERFGLHVEDEILEVNGATVKNMSHHEIVMLVHQNKKSITLKVRRYPPPPYDYVVERPIDVPSAYQNRSNGYVNKTTGEASPKTRVDGMMKFRLHPKAEILNRDSNVPSKFYNEAFERDEDDDIPTTSHESDFSHAKSINLPQIVTVLDRMKQKLKTQRQDDLMFLQQLLNSKRFKSVIKTHNRMTRIHLAKKGIEIHKPVATNSLFLLTEVRLMLMEMSDSASVALSKVINKPDFKELLTAHDHIAMRESLDIFTEMEDDASDIDGSDILDVFPENDEENVKIVRIDKTNEPLGATVRNEGDKVLISRIVKGGAAEKSGLLHEGDEILEINENSVRGKDVNEVVELLIELEGTLTFVLIPGQATHKDTLRDEGHTVMKALFDYEPKTDDYIPCVELGLQFRKGDLLEILNQADPDWWQAQIMENNHNKGGLAGLVPSKQFQLQRELSKITLIGEDTEPILKEKKRCFCGRARRKGKKVPMKSRNAPVEESQILTYEEMVRVFPDKRKKRPVVLIGPPQVGRREIRERLIMEYPERFAAAVPHTTRERTEAEINGIDYQFVSRSSFENSIATAEFIEHGVLGGDYYGTSFSAVESVIKSGKTCVLNMYCQALPVLKDSHLRPFVVFITVPRIDQLKRLRELDDTCEPFNPHVRLKDNELDELIEKARDMYRTHGHYFDKTLVNNDLDKTFDDLVSIFNSLEQDPQWIYSSWVR